MSTPISPDQQNIAAAVIAAILAVEKELVKADARCLGKPARSGYYDDAVQCVFDGLNDNEEVSTWPVEDLTERTHKFFLLTSRWWSHDAADMERRHSALENIRDGKEIKLNSSISFDDKIAFHALFGGNEDLNLPELTGSDKLFVLRKNQSQQLKVPPPPKGFCRVPDNIHVDKEGPRGFSEGVLYTFKCTYTRIERTAEPLARFAARKVLEFCPKLKPLGQVDSGVSMRAETFEEILPEDVKRDIEKFDNVQRWFVKLALRGDLKGSSNRRSYSCWFRKKTEQGFLMTWKMSLKDISDVLGTPKFSDLQIIFDEKIIGKRLIVQKKNGRLYAEWARGLNSEGYEALRSDSSSMSLKFGRNQQHL